MRRPPSLPAKGPSGDADPTSEPDSVSVLSELKHEGALEPAADDLLDRDSVDELSDSAVLNSASSVLEDSPSLDSPVLPEEVAPGGDDEEVRISQARLAEAKAAKRDLKAASRQRRKAERREANRFTVELRRRRLSFWLGFGGLALVVSFALFFAYGPVFTVREFQINGVTEEQSALIVASLESQQGKPLALVNEAEIEAALAQFPFIASFDVQVHPPELLVINLVPRVAVGYLDDGAGNYQLVDGAGVILNTFAAPPADYASLGQMTLNSVEFTAAASVVLSLPAELRAELTRVSAETGNDVMLYLGDGNTRVMWGSPDDSALKLVVLEALMEVHPSPGRIYDVSSPEAAVIRG